MSWRHRRRLAGVLMVLYLIVLALIVLWPEPVDRPISHEIYAFVIWAHQHGMPWMSYKLIEFSSNVVMFIPFGVILTVLLGRRRWWMATIAGVLFSSAIELAQFLLLPDRYPSGRDVIANSTGALIGSLIVLVIGTLIARRRPPRAAAVGVVPTSTSAR
ncbi:VanZ family protein [Leifsonia sp. Leaf264]|uniref:VanZ family protein n=1 Tax=Leifsonia sp. Leaf264 TaxID=1736314 RepID=UPI0009EB65F2|nr:VanZ family protein [Leifsonia sp. Leaf264]